MGEEGTERWDFEGERVGPAALPIELVESVVGAKVVTELAVGEVKLWEAERRGGDMGNEPARCGEKEE